MSMFIGVRSRAPRVRAVHIRRAGVAGLAVLLSVGFGAGAQAEPGKGQNQAEEEVWVEVCHRNGNSGWVTKRVRDTASGDEDTLSRHLEHGDSIGPCTTEPPVEEPPVEEPPVEEPPVEEPPVEEPPVEEPPVEEPPVEEPPVEEPPVEEPPVEEPPVEEPPVEEPPVEEPPVEEPPVEEPPVEEPEDVVVVVEIQGRDDDKAPAKPAGTVNRPAAEVKPEAAAPASSLPATGAPSGLMVQGLAGLMMLVLGALTLRGRRTRSS